MASHPAVSIPTCLQCALPQSPGHLFLAPPSLESAKGCLQQLEKVYTPPRPAALSSSLPASHQGGILPSYSPQVDTGQLCHWRQRPSSFWVPVPRLGKGFASPPWAYVYCSQEGGVLPSNGRSRKVLEDAGCWGCFGPNLGIWVLVIGTNPVEPLCFMVTVTGNGIEAGPCQETAP